MAPTAPWKKEWSAASYVWPVISTADSIAVEKVGRQVISRGGRALKEAHADRGVVIDFPNGAGTRVRKQVTRAECRRRAQVTLTDVAAAPVKVCVVCDAVHLWPAFKAASDVSS